MDSYMLFNLMWGILSLFISVLLGLCAWEKATELYHCMKKKRGK